ncbi:hypothetical protein BGZ52_002423 [Haplosporangium bisporale]|nr:hypothetical protein BGZ52_002423 [Haplosporangium bisporale]
MHTAVSQVLVVVACGVILSKTGYLSQTAQKSISKVNLYFMTPCLLFTKIASTINWTQFLAFWPIPVFYVFFSSVSWGVAKVGSRLLGYSKDEEKFVIASVLFSNTNSLPMALLQSLAFSAAGSRLLRDENDTKIEVAARGISYILFYAIFGNLVRWSYGFTLLVPKDDPVEDQEEEPVLYQPQPIQPAQSILINVDGPSSRRSDASTLTIPSIYRSETENDVATPKANNAYPTFIPNLQTDRNSLHPLSIPSSSNPGLSVAHSPSASTRSFLYQKTTSAFDRVRQVLTPPLLTALMALVIGLVPYLHQLFMSPDSTVYRFLIRPVENCGDAAIPMILLCLGAQVVHFAEQSKTDAQKPEVQKQAKNKKPASYPPQGLGIYTAPTDEYCDEERTSTDGLAPEPYGKGIATLASNASSSATLLHFSNTDAQGSDHRQGKGSSSSRQTTNRTRYNDDDGSDDEALPLLPSSVRKDGPHYRIRWMTPIPFILFSRMVLVPAISLPAILYHPESLSPILTMDPTFSLALVLLAAAPTAINMIQICQIKGFFEHEMAAVLFWSYCVFGIPCVLGWSLVGLWAAGR